jgi:hypothetical protein
VSLKKLKFLLDIYPGALAISDGGRISDWAYDYKWNR